MLKYLVLTLFLIGTLGVQAQQKCVALFPTETTRAAFLGFSHEDAATARIHFMENETKEIRAAYYQFDGNKVGKVFAGFLINAQKNGVRSRLLLDAWNPESWVDERVSPELYYVMMKNGVDVRIHNPIDPDSFSKFLKLGNYTRMHDKLLIFSGQNVVTTGDRNVQNSYFGPLQHKKGLKGKSTTSTEIVVQGEEITRASEKYFDQMWSVALPPEIDMTKLDLNKVALIEKQLVKFKDLIDAKENLHVDWQERLNKTEVAEIEFVHDVPGKKGQAPGIAESILKEIDSAEDFITIYAPYTFFSDRFLDAIDRVLARGVKITLVLPSWQSVDTPITLQHFEKQAAQLRKKGVKLIQHTGDNFMHAKVMIVDTKSVFVGSYNFNKRSELNDYESGFIVRDEAFVKEVRKFDLNFQKNEGTGFVESKKSFFDSIKVSLLRFFARIIPFLGRQL
jgi:putative cardiolipin synthase